MIRSAMKARHRHLRRKVFCRAVRCRYGRYIIRLRREVFTVTTGRQNIPGIAGGGRMATINDVCDYIISKVAQDGLSLLKLQKLLYYCQAWHLAFDKGQLFRGRFQAWVHGPVNREIYDRFKDKKALYDAVSDDDIRADFSYENITVEQRAHIDAVLNVYCKFTGDQLEAMTHEEEPWITARCGIPLHQRCENNIDEELMGGYYKSRLAQDK